VAPGHGTKLSEPARSDGIASPEPLPFSADPEYAVLVFDDRRDPLFDAGDGRERLRVSIEHGEPVLRSHPEALRAILVDHGNEVVRQAVGVGGVVLEDGETVAVVAMESFLRTEPEEAEMVLADGLDRLLRKPLQPGEADPVGARLARREAEEQYEHTAEPPVLAQAEVSRVMMSDGTW